jgi:hypothetical protein
LTAHWITKNWERKNFMLSMKHFEGTHDATNVNRIFNEMLTEWAIPVDKCNVTLRDHASNMIKVFDLLLIN